MNDQEETLDLLDLDEESGVDSLPEVSPLSSPRPKRPWLLIGLGMLIIVLATWIVIARLGGGAGETLTTIDLDTEKTEVINDNTSNLAKDIKVPEKSTIDISQKQKAQQSPEQVSKQDAVEKNTTETDGIPVRVVKDRQEDITFNPNKKEVKNTTGKSSVQKVKTTKSVKQSNGGFYVQFGSYSSRSLAQSAESNIRKAHNGLLKDRQFVILAAEINGKTVYRLRIAFSSVKEADGFCRNAKSDGLDCYVTK